MQVGFIDHLGSISCEEVFNELKLLFENMISYSMKNILSPWLLAHAKWNVMRNTTILHDYMYITAMMHLRLRKHF